MKANLWVRALCILVSLVFMSLFISDSSVYAKAQDKTSLIIGYQNDGSKCDKIIETAVKKAQLSSDKVKNAKILIDKGTGEGVVQVVERKDNIIEVTNIAMYRTSDNDKLVNAIKDDQFASMSYTSEYIPFEFTLDWNDIGIPITIVTTGLSYVYFVGSPIQCVYMKPFNVQARWYRDNSNYSVTRIQAEHYMQAPKYHFDECLDDEVYSDSDLIANEKCTLSAYLSVYYPTINTTYYGYNSLPSDIAMGLNSSDALDEYDMWYMILHYLEYTFWYSNNNVPVGSETARYDYYDAAYPDE